MRLLPDAASCCQLCLQLLPDAALPLLASLPLFPLAPRPATALSRRLSQQHLPDAAALSSMQGLPRSGNSSAQTSASLHPPAALRLRCLPFTRDMGVHGLCGRVPDSARNVSPWIAAAQTDANLSAQLHRLPTPPPYLRRMRLSPGRGAGIRWVIRLPPGQGRRCLVLDEACRLAGCGVPANHRARESLF